MIEFDDPAPPYHGHVTRTSVAARTYQVRTYGCQMNVHDSERLAGLLEAAGYVKAEDGSDADVVVFNTCAVRENADNKLYGNLSHLAPRKHRDPGMQIAVGGCLAQKDRDAVATREPRRRPGEGGPPAGRDVGAAWLQRAAVL